MSSTAFLYDEVFLSHKMPPAHPESGERLLACLDAVRTAGLWDRLMHLAPRRADPEEVALAHSVEYVQGVSTFGSGYLDADTYVSPDTYEAALFAAGAVLTAVDAALAGEARRSFCAVRPPGHHAEQDRGMGFCIFNNVAVGARYALRRGVGKVLIADFDVHHGNGTQNIFYEDDTVFYFSTHQFPHYPGTGSASEKGRGRGEGCTLNIPLPPGSGDEEMEEAYGMSFRETVASFQPEMILVSAGYDLHRSDPLSGFTVSDEGVARLVDEILAAGSEIPVIFSLEGGYDLRSLGKSVVLTLERMMDPL